MEQTRMIPCKSEHCGITVRHEKVWRQVEGLGRVYVWSCWNCGQLIVPRVTYLSTPDGEQLEFITKAQVLRAMK